MEMSITRALSELKLLEGRISSSIRNLNVIAIGKKSWNTVKGNGDKSKELFIKDAQSSFDSVVSLINRRAKIKSAIVLSNANTEIKIGNKTLTVAEAIERKNFIIYEQQFLQELKSQWAKAVHLLDMENNEVQEKLNRMIEAMTGKDNMKDIAVQSNDLTKGFLEKNIYELVDPVKLEQKIANLETEINLFLHEVDYALSESNAITKITIED